MRALDTRKTSWRPTASDDAVIDLAIRRGYARNKSSALTLALSLLRRWMGDKPAATR